jgi:hypothetical protein
MHKPLDRYALVVVAWLPFFAIWVLIALSYANTSVSSALLTSTISMGSASLLGFAVWYLCQRWPWPLRITISFYLLQVLFAVTYTLLWFAVVCWLEGVRYHRPVLSVFHEFVISHVLAWQLLMGVWIYGYLLVSPTLYRRATDYMKRRRLRCVRKHWPQPPA